MNNFCTIFDSNYLSRGLAMYNSLKAYCADFHLYIVCLDQNLYELLNSNNYSNISTINLPQIESKYPEILVAKGNRTYVEYIFTLSPIIALYVLEEYSKVDMITTLDADLFFFSDPTVLFRDKDAFSIAITPHNFKDSLKKHAKYGKYNVSFQSFKRDEIGLACLREWQNNCLKWCYDKYEDNKFADQKYLDSWIKTYPKVKEFNSGSGIAPWNICNKDISIKDGEKIYIKNKPLIYFHFHGLRNDSEKLFSLGLIDYRVILRSKIIKYIYSKYIHELSEIQKSIKTNHITRKTHPKLGRIVYLVFLADLYYYKNGKMVRFPNLNIVRCIYSFIKSIFFK